MISMSQFSSHIRTTVASQLLLAAIVAVLFAIGCDSSSGGSAGNTLSATARWASNHDVNLALLLPDGMAVNIVTPQAGGCALDGDQVGPPAGTGVESITCTPPLPSGDYVVSLLNRGPGVGSNAAVTLDITVNGVITSETVNVTVTSIGFPAMIVSRTVTLP